MSKRFTREHSIQSCPNLSSLNSRAPTSNDGWGISGLHRHHKALAGVLAAGAFTVSGQAFAAMPAARTTMPTGTYLEIINSGSFHRAEVYGFPQDIWRYQFTGGTPIFGSLSTG